MSLITGSGNRGRCALPPPSRPPTLMRLTTIKLRVWNSVSPWHIPFQGTYKLFYAAAFKWTIKLAGWQWWRGFNGLRSILMVSAQCGLFIGQKRN